MPLSTHFLLFCIISSLLQFKQYSRVTGCLQNDFGIFKRQNFTNVNVNGSFPVYQRISSVVKNGYLYRLLNGTFVIAIQLNNDMFMRLVGKETPVSDKWEYKNKNINDNWIGDKLIRLEPLESFIPNSYIVSSTGPASNKYSDRFGVYTKTEKNCSGCPIYLQSNLSHYHFLLNFAGNWIISKSNTCSQPKGDLLKWSYGSPFPPTFIHWRYYTVTTGTQGAFAEDKDMMVYSFNDDTTHPNRVASTNDQPILSKLQIAIIFISSLVFVAILVIVVFLTRWLKSRQIARETATVDNNFYYRDEDYDEEYQETAFTDQNDYYAL